MAKHSLILAFLSASTMCAAVDYNRDIRPILSEKCLQCHGPDEKKRFAGLRLDTPEGAATRNAIVPGHADSSGVIRRITATGPTRMPLGKEPLNTREIEILRQWIQEGARYEAHWSYRPPVRPPLPAVKQTAWPANPIDRFLLARLESQNLAPSPTGPPAVLLRRIYLDLTGLPPSPSEVQAFEANPSPKAYEAAVDRLLASPHFGEKWARHWLDLARYGESSGYQHDDLRSVWPYRDWVIRAFNRDMPFDRFTIEQLAGDLLPNATLDQKIATGLHRNATVNLGGDITLEESRHNVRVDQVNTTGIVWLAATVGCAQCHTHKYDPITHRDYYRLYAYFNNAEETVIQPGEKSQRKRYLGASVSLPVPADQAAAYERRVAEHKTLAAKLNALETTLARALPEWEKSTAPSLKLLPDLQATLKKPVAQRNEVESDRLLQFYLGSQSEITELRAKEMQARKAMEAIRPPECLIMSEKPKPEPTWLLLRGTLGNRGEAVTPGTPEAIGPPGDDFPPNRLGLAKWLVDRRNPLTARVAANRIWGEIFGAGLVITTEDFGRQGEAPSHPELLDWLAVEFMDSGWSMKHMIRLMVTSSAYRQTSAATRELLTADPSNRLLARGPRFRHDAEAIRDITLSAAGLLSLKVGGAPVHPPQPKDLWNEIAGRDDTGYPESKGEDRFRRGIYTVWRRGNPYPTFLNFDASPRMDCVARRIRTNTPVQALTLLNDPAFIEAAAALGERLRSQSATLEDRIRLGFRLCTSRQPKPAELTALQALYQRTLDRHPGPDAEQSAWLAVARALLNLDETITKG